MLRIDGSQGEGGGQVLRTSLALSLVTGTPFRIEGIRSRRKRPGLLRQHLACVRAAAEIGHATVEGDHLGSTRLRFEPGHVEPGNYRFAVGSAGSATLVFQTVLPALLSCDGDSSLSLEGGTHNPAAPPFDFIERTFVPAIAKLGAEVEVRLDRHGFYPAGGGRFSANVSGAWHAEAIDWQQRGQLQALRACAIVSQLPATIAQRELDTLATELGACECDTLVVRHPRGPGNAVLVDVVSSNGTEVLAGFGERGVKAEVVARRLAAHVLSFVNADVPVGEHLADQMIPYLALGAGGRFATVEPSSHTRTQIEIVRAFVARDIRTARDADGRWWVEVGS